MLYGCTIWTLTKRMEKKLDSNDTGMLRAILNNPRGTPPQSSSCMAATKTMKVRRTRHAGHCWRSRDELVSDVLLRAPTYGRAKAGRPARTYIQQLYTDTGCDLEDQPEAIDDREWCRERVSDIRADSATQW